MASHSAVEASRVFCGEGLYSVNASQARTALANVPPNDEGLRLLAANGNWSDVLMLAERLEEEVAVQARRHPSQYAFTFSDAPMPDASSFPETSPSAVSQQANSPPLPIDTVVTTSNPAITAVAAATARSILSVDSSVRGARLPYVLVQVTALLKMRRIAAAKKVIDALGDIEGEGFRFPDTKESFAPFSLRFVAAFLPFYMGVPMEAQKRLYTLLEECLARVRSFDESDAAGSPVPAIGDGHPTDVSRATHQQQRTWAARVLRLQRALLHVHIHQNQHSLAHELAALVLSSDDYECRTCGDLSEGLYRLRHVLQLQQLFCLALHVGDSQRAQATLKTIREAAADAVDGDSGAGATQVPPTESVAPANGQLFHLIVTSCDAFLAAFRSEYHAAVDLFGEVVARCAHIKQKFATNRDSGSAGAYLSVPSDGTVSEEALRRWVLQGICANAQISQSTCLAYCSDIDPTAHMGSLCHTLEGYAKAEPHVLCHSDAFVESLVRFYTLAGEQQSNLNRLADLLEVFRCDRGALPNLEALV